MKIVIGNASMVIDRVAIGSIVFAMLIANRQQVANRVLVADMVLVANKMLVANKVTDIIVMVSFISSNNSLSTFHNYTMDGITTNKQVAYMG